MGACRKLLHDDEAIQKKIKIELNTPKDNFKQEIKQPGWNNLSLNYTVPWPLHLILSPKVLSKYNEVFRFLLLAKRTQILLHEAWATLCFHTGI